MADVNVNAPADQAPTMAPPTRIDDQILPYIRWASPARKSRSGLVSKRSKPISSLRLGDEFIAEGIPEKEPRVDYEKADVQRALEESLKSIYDVPRGPHPPVVIRELESMKYQLLLETPKKRSLADQYIFQRRTSTPIGSSGIDAGVQGEGQAGPNTDDQDEGQVGPNPGDATASQPLPSLVVHAGPNLEYMDLEVTDVSTQPHPEQMDEGFTATAYPNPLQAATTETTTTTTIHLPPSQPQQSTTDSMLMQCISELEHIMANLIQDNKHLEERLDSHGARLYTFENLDIPQQVSKAVYEIVTDVVDWAIQAPLHNRFRDLPD
nr:hypothetical protein [Tanacetum cinerariifolium]